MPGGVCPYCGTRDNPLCQRPPQGSGEWWDDPSYTHTCSKYSEDLGNPSIAYG